MVLTGFVPAICQLWDHGAKKILSQNLKPWLCFKIENGSQENSILNIIKTKACLFHTAGSDTIFVQIYMDARPGVPGVSKNQNFFLQIKLLSFCAKTAPKRHKLQKLSKLKKKTCFLRVFWLFFKLKAILAHQTSNCLVVPGASFDTPGGGSL